MPGAAVTPSMIVRLAREGGLPDRLYLIGPPGVGKTESVMEACRVEGERLGRRIVELESVSGDKLLGIYREVREAPSKFHVCARLVAPHVLPEDTGYPRVDDGSGVVVYHPPLQLAILGVEGVSGILFIDELSNVARDDQKSLFYALINEKRFGWSLRLSSLVKIVAAGNPSTVSSLAEPLPAPLINRMIVVHVEAPGVDEWVAYMEEKYGVEWSRLTAAYLERNPGDIYQPPQSEALEDVNFATPRSWTRLALELYRVYGEEAARRIASGDPVALALVYGSLGPGVGGRLVSYAKKLSKLPPVSRLVSNPTLLARLVEREPVDTIVYIIHEMVGLLKAERLEYRDAARVLAALAKAGRSEEASLALSVAARAGIQISRILSELVKMGEREAISRLRTASESIARMAKSLGV